MVSSIAVESPKEDLPDLSVTRADPLAWLIARLFRAHHWLLFWLVALGGAAAMYGISAIDGTLLPRPGFDAATTDINSAIIWLLLVPIASVAYVAQLTAIPALFADLQRSGVTGLTPHEYAKFIEDCRRAYNHPYWAVLALVAFAAPWALFMEATAASPHNWYYPAALWPWWIYCAIQYLEIYAALMYATRYAITCVQLRKLLRSGVLRPRFLFKRQFCRPERPLEPRFLHPDGLGGCGAVLRFVLQTLVIGGGVLVVVTLESVNTARTVSHFNQGSGLPAFLVVAALYATVVPYLLLYPLRLTLESLRKAKYQIAAKLSAHESRVIWQRIVHLDNALEPDRDEHIEVLIRSLNPLGQISAALDTVPGSLVELGQRSSQALVLAAVVPSLVAVGYRVASDVWGWNLDALIRTLLTSH
jgi:hypothetical protein